MSEVWQREGRVLTEAASQHVCDLLSHHIALMTKDDICVPKHNVLYHALHKVLYQGNPRFYACWFDEALNKVLKRGCKDTSQANDEGPVLVRMMMILDDMAKDILR